jgi:hypothetical protein
LFSAADDLAFLDQSVECPSAIQSTMHEVNFFRMEVFARALPGGFAAGAAKTRIASARLIANATFW